MASPIPPDIMAALGGGAPGGAPAGDPSEQGESNAVDILKQMIDLAKQYLNVEPDEEDKATMTDVLSRLQQYLAKDQSEMDGAMQGKVSPRLLRKSASGPAAA